TREPCVVAPIKTAADAHGRNAGDVGAIRKGGAHEIKLIFDADESVGDRDNVPLALKFGAAEDSVGLRVERFVQVADAWSTRASITITCVASQRAEYEPGESCVVGGCLKSERAGPAAQTNFDRLGSLNFEIWVAFVEGVGCVMTAAGKQFRGFWCALDVL